MRIGPGFFGSLFTGSRGWEMVLDGESVTYAKTSQTPIRVALTTISGAVADAGAIWAEIQIAAPNQNFACDGILNNVAEKFVAGLRCAVGNALLTTIGRHERELNELAAGLLQLLAQPRYVAHRDL